MNKEQKPLKPADLRKIPGYKEFKNYFTSALAEIRKFNLTLAMNLNEYWEKFFGKEAEYHHVKLNEFNIEHVEMHLDKVEYTIKNFFYDDFYHSQALRDWMNYFKRHKTPYNLVLATNKNRSTERRYILFVKQSNRKGKEEDV